MYRWLCSALLPLTLLVGVLAWSGTATAAPGQIGQTQAGNPPASLRVLPTKTGHELGVGLHLTLPPNVAFLPRARYRYQFSQTAAQGPLSGLWLEAAIGPAVYSNPDGNAAVNLGYEFDPFTNLALTFSPVLRNDFFFDAGFFGYSVMFGTNMRLYIKSNWVVFVNPFAFGMFLSNFGCCSFAYQGGAGFGYKF